MGYLITTGIQKFKIEISQAIIPSLNVPGVQIIKSNDLKNYTIIGASLTMKNAIGDITGFGHFYLEYQTSGNKLAVYDENIGTVNDRQSNFLINASHPPNRFGSVSNYLEDLLITTELSGIATGDLICTVYYINN
jgi:hypothetical protein